MRSFVQDLRYGCRVLLGSPAFTLVAVLTLALGIAVNTTVFSWIDSVLLSPLAGVRDGRRLVALERVDTSSGGFSISYRDYRDYRDHLKLVSALAVSRHSPLNLGEGEHAQRVWGELVSGNYFAVLGVKPFLGRFFLAEEQGEKPGAYPVAVLSHNLWRTRFQADPGVIGKTLKVNRRELTIIGVAPREFSGILRGVAFDIWVPLMMGPQLSVDDERMFQHRGFRNVVAIGRLKPGASLEQARAEAAALAAQLAHADPSFNDGSSVTILPELDSHLGGQALFRGPLRILMAMCVLVLLIVCANTANLLLARSISRRKEFSIRLALGSGRLRLVRQLLTESLLLAGLGVVVGIPLAMWLRQSIVYLMPASGPPIRMDELELHGPVLGFMIVICLAAALVSGLAPALEAVRSDVNATLKEGGRSASPGARPHRLRGLLVISEMALALVALVVAGLFVRSFYTIIGVNPGFDARNVLVARLYLAGSGYKTEQQSGFCLRLRDRLRAAPGIQAVTYADNIPLGFASGGAGHYLTIEGYVPRRDENMTISRSIVAPGYLELLRIPLMEGRDFSERDDLNTAPVMIVNQTFARRFFAGGSAIGRKVRNWGRWHTVVGVARDSKYYNPAEAPRPYIYLPFRQMYSLGHDPDGVSIAFYLRTPGDPRAALPGLRQAVAALDPGVTFDALPLAEYNAMGAFRAQLGARLLSVLGLASLLLAAGGLYSVMAYAVSQRTYEFGIRMALGAPRLTVLGMVVRHGMVLALAGVAAGTAAALAATRLVAGMLFHVSPTDPAVFAAAAAFVAVVALAASYWPARRATKLDPMVALRCQ